MLADANLVEVHPGLLKTECEEKVGFEDFTANVLALFGVNLIHLSTLLIDALLRKAYRILISYSGHIDATNMIQELRRKTPNGLHNRKIRKLETLFEVPKPAINGDRNERFCSYSKREKEYY